MQLPRTRTRIQASQSMNRAIVGGGLVLGIDVFVAGVVLLFREATGPDPD